MTTLNDTTPGKVEFYATHECEADLLTTAPRLFTDDGQMMLEVMGGEDGHDFTYRVLECVALLAGVTVVVTESGKGYSVFVLPTPEATP